MGSWWMARLARRLERYRQVAKKAHRIGRPSEEQGDEELGAGRSYVLVAHRARAATLKSLSVRTRPPAAKTGRRRCSPRDREPRLLHSGLTRAVAIPIITLGSQPFVHDPDTTDPESRRSDVDVGPVGLVIDEGHDRRTLDRLSLS